MTKQDFVTKEFLSDSLEKFGSDLKSELLEIKVEIIKEIKDMREEFDTHQYSHVRINDEIQDREKRIKVLESVS